MEVFQYLSSSIYKFLGHNPEYLIGKSPLEFAHPKNIGILKMSFSNFITEKEAFATLVRLRNIHRHYSRFESKDSLVKVHCIALCVHSGTRAIIAQ